MQGTEYHKQRHSKDTRNNKMCCYFGKDHSAFIRLRDKITVESNSKMHQMLRNPKDWKEDSKRCTQNACIEQQKQSKNDISWEKGTRLGAQEGRVR